MSGPKYLQSSNLEYICLSDLIHVNLIVYHFQIFNTYRFGYHFKLFNDRFFIEPSLAMTHRIYHTEMPSTFKNLDDKWSKFFFPEPGLHVGFNF